LGFPKKTPNPNPPKNWEEIKNGGPKKSPKRWLRNYHLSPKEGKISLLRSKKVKKRLSLKNN